MIRFLLGIPEIVLYGCGALIAVAFAMSIALFWKTRRVGSHVRAFASALSGFGDGGLSRRHDGLPLAALDEIRSQCEKLDEAPRAWWQAIDSHIERYTSPEDLECWLLTERARELLPYEIVVGK